MLFAQWWRRGKVFEKKPGPDVRWVSGGSLSDGRVEVSLHDVRLPNRAEFYVFEDPGPAGRPRKRLKTVTCDMYDPTRITGCRYNPSAFDVEPHPSVSFKASIGEVSGRVGIVFFAAWRVTRRLQRRQGVPLNEFAASWFFRAGA
ncbi:MAG TPA: hypothetical protein VG318_01630 [Actinomycetota bacterium]|nr:hypothetical protein [Actinomycetota bacterium]